MNRSTLSIKQPVTDTKLGLRRIAIVCHPWDIITPQMPGNSITIIADQIAHQLSSNYEVLLYSRRAPGQKRHEMSGPNVILKRLVVCCVIHQLLEIVTGIFSRLLNISMNRAIGKTLMSTRLYYFFYALRAALSIRAAKCDIVIVHNFLQFATIIKYFNRSAIICLHMHQAWLEQYATPRTEGWLCRVDLIFGVSEYITQGIRTRFPTIAARCHTIYNGVDTDRFSPVLVPSTQNGTRYSILYVGRLSPEKGVHVLIEAFKRLGERWPTLELHLVGAESLLPYIYLYPSRDPVSASVEVYYGSNFRDIVRRQLITRGNGYLRSLVATASGDQRIVFHGEVPHTAIINFYRSATILVVPSVCNEAFGIPAIEAAACGVPVIATRSGGLPEVILHGRTGLVVSRQNAEALSGAIDELLSAPERASAMGRAGRERVLSCFSWDNSARCLVDLIESAALSRSTNSVGLTPLDRTRDG